MPGEALKPLLWRGLVFAALAALTLGVGTAYAELAQRGNLFVRFDGGISPRTLPRTSLAPIGVRIEGTIRTPRGHKPPNLRRIRIALNRGGRLSSRGLAKCPKGRIDATTPSEALAACGPALVGSGGFTARTSFPDQPTYLLRGQILLFNSRVQGREAILAHVFQAEPAPITRFIVFQVRRQGGTFGTVITGEVPEAVYRNGYMKTIYLSLNRRYAFRGDARSYLSASCPAPAGFPGAVFPFAKASMSFEDGRTLSSILTRSCKVRNRGMGGRNFNAGDAKVPGRFHVARPHL